MGVFYETIPETLVKWVHEQKVFWVATAPLAGHGHVNVSPKGGQYFGIIDEKTFWYLDLSGSGNETISHLLEPGNGRITIQFCAFEGPPKIVRFWGKGRILEYETPSFHDFVDTNSVTLLPGTRSIILVDIHQVGSSCGFSVPYFDFKEHRTTLNDLWGKRARDVENGKSDSTMPRYWAYKNAYSMDGLPGLPQGLSTAKAETIAPIKKMVGPLAPKNRSSYHAESFKVSEAMVLICVGFLVGILFTLYGPIALEYGRKVENIESLKMIVRRIGVQT